MDMLKRDLVIKSNFMQITKILYLTIIPDVPSGVNIMKCIACICIIEM